MPAPTHASASASPTRPVRRIGQCKASDATNTRTRDRRSAAAARPDVFCACGGICPRCRRQKKGAARSSPPADRRSAPEVDAGERAWERLSPHPAGQPLPPGTRARFERAFGRDFARVRVHDDPRAHAVAEALAAQAFMLGGDIWFGAGKYAPGTAAGDRLLAHELTHVAQLVQGRIPAGVPQTLADATDPAEAEAHANEGAVLARLPRTSSGAASEPVATASPAAVRPPVSTRIYRSPSSETAATTETTEPGDPDAAAEAADPVLEELVSEFREARPADAFDLLTRLASLHNLDTTVARLDAEGLLDSLFRDLGPDAWLEPARTPMLAILTVRAPEANAATIEFQVETGLLEVDLRVSGEEARTVFKILDAMAPDQRLSFLGSDEGQQAFEKLPDRKQPGLRVAREFAFTDEDLEALLVELENPETWEQENEPWLRTLFWMAVQSGHAGDPRVVAFVTDNWDTHGDFFAEQGLRADGELTMERLRERPKPFWLFWRGAGLALNNDLLGAVEIALPAVSNIWGKKGRTLEQIPLDELQRTLGGTLFGIRLDGFEGAPVSGKLSIEVNPGEGELIIRAPFAYIPTASWGGEGLQGPIAVTARDLTLTGLEVISRWPAKKTLVDQDSLHVQLGSLEVGQFVATSARVETAYLTDVLVEDITIDIDLGPFREGDGTHVVGVVREIERQLQSLVEVLHATLGSLVSTLTPSGTDLPTTFVGELKRVLSERLGGEMLLVATVGELRAGAVDLPGAASASVQTWFELVVGAGPRAVAEIELRRLRAKEASELTNEERIRIAELEVAQSNPDRKAADAVLRGLGIAPDDVVLQLATETAPGEEPLRLSGVGISTAQTRFDEVTGESATLTVTFPAAAPAPSKPGSAPPEMERNKQGLPLYRIELDVTGGALPAGGEGKLLGDEATAGPLTFAGMEGHADVFPDRRIELDATLHKVACEKLAWGITIDAPGGIADTVHVYGSVQLTEAGEFEIAEGAALSIDIDLLGALQVTLEKPGKFRAVAEDPTLLGLHAVLAAGALPTVHVETGTIAGFEGAVGALLNARSEQPLSFRDFELAALVDLGIYQFSFGDLESGTIDFELAGRRLSVTYFEGAVEGVVTDQLSGSVSIDPKEDLVLGRLGLHLNPLSEKFGAVDLGWKSLRLHDSRLDLTWAFVTPASADRTQAEEASALGVSLSGLHAKSATATGLRLTTQLAGAQVAVSMDAQGEATIYGLDVPSMKLLIAEDFLMAEGAVSGESLVAQGLVAKLGPLLELHLNASSQALRFDALSDGNMPFALDNLSVQGNAVVLKDGQPLRSWFVHLDADVSGQLDREGLDLALDQPLVAGGAETAELDKITAHIDKDAAAVTLEGGRYTRDHLDINFKSLSANVVLGMPGDKPAALGNLNLTRSAFVDGLPILKFSDISLAGASFEIDDLSALIGWSEMVQLFPTLKDLAKHTSGDASFRALVTFPSVPDAGEPYSYLDVSTKIKDGTLFDGVMIPNRGPTIYFAGDFFPALLINGVHTDMKLVEMEGRKGVMIRGRFVGVKVPMEITWPPGDPAEVDTTGPNPSITGLENVNIVLQATPTEIQILDVAAIHLDQGAVVDLTVVGSTASALNVTLNVNETSARALLWDMFDFAAEDIRIDQGVNLQIEFSGLTVKKVTGTIKSGSIDTATLGVLGKK